MFFKGFFNVSGFIGRVNEYKIKGLPFENFRQGLTDDVMADDCTAGFKSAKLQILMDNITVKVNKDGMIRTPAQGFDTQSPGSGKKVQHPRLPYGMPKDIENGLFCPVGRWPDPFSFNPDKFSAFSDPTDNSHGYSDSKIAFLIYLTLVPSFFAVEMISPPSREIF